MAASLSTKCLAFLLTNVESSKIKLFKMSGNEGIYILFLFFTTEFVTVFTQFHSVGLLSRDFFPYSQLSAQSLWNFCALEKYLIIMQQSGECQLFPCGHCSWFM